MQEEKRGGPANQGSPRKQPLKWRLVVVHQCYYHHYITAATSSMLTMCANVLPEETMRNA